MKRLSSLLAAVLFLGTAVSLVRAQAEVSVDFFHDNLEAYGDWREVGDYGYCWQPRDVAPDWRPYSDGRWLYTDAGWTWDSEEPYSWAVYHYGRWARVDRVGWVWVPGTEWGPAWVSWRRSPQYVGWAPLPPDAQFNRSVGFSGRVDADYDIGPANYSFIEVRNFGAPRLRTVIVEPRQNLTIINQTTNITRITYVNNGVYNQGPQYDVISRESALPVRRLKLERREKFDGDSRAVRADQLNTKVEGDSLRVFALPFDAKPATAPRKVAAKVEKAKVDRGWENAGPPAEVAKLRTRIKNEPAAPAELTPPPKVNSTSETPVVAPVSPPVPNEKAVKGKPRNGGPPTPPDAPIKTEVAPPPPEKPMAPEKPVKPTKEVKPMAPEIEITQPSPPPAAAAPIESKKGKNKGTKEPSTGAAPQEKMPKEAPKSEEVEPTRTPPLGAVAPPRQKTPPNLEGKRPKLELPPVRSVEREAPKIPERAQPKKPEAPSQAAPAIPQPATVKPKGKAKEEKKDDGKPEGAPQ